ncbi:PQQ-binding-like beta-propeller repeat protein [Halovivax limisalsi]|uniref:outer membrane protein assembly factor BamB family protein n=1 Tax=Halovivax limisalsi TaxID=1453760 RepID=UPI001FFC3B27|nr:PQQ-binding-like beta-propeller repeat protein [Halovivax limisalsi]
MKRSRDSTRDRRGRRELLSSAGAALVAGLAGCAGTLDGDETPDSTNEPGDAGDRLRPDLTDAAPYRMHQYGPDHAGVADGAGPTAAVDVAWTFREGADDTYYEIGTPAIVDGTVYVAEGRSDDEAEAATGVYALDGATGEVEWEQTFPGTNALGSTAVVDGAVVQQLGGMVVVLEADTGAERWRERRDLSNPVTVADDTVYAIETAYADPPTLVALSLADGGERWTEPLADDGRFWPTAPAVVDGTVYQGGSELVALSATDGERRWTRDLDAPVVGSPTVADGDLYAPLGDGTVRAYDLDGTPRWTQPVESAASVVGTPFVSSPAVAEGTCYVVNAWQVSALDVQDGSIRWTTEGDADGTPLVADGVVYIGGLSAAAAYDGASGDRLWHHDSAASTGAGRVTPVVGDAVLYPSGGLHALVEQESSS